MALVYFDSSALVKLVLEEEGSAVAERLWDASDSAVTSRIAYPEVRAAMAAAVRSQRLTARAATQAVRYWQGDWESIRRVELTPVVEQLAGELAHRHGLRGADAVHLASALAVGPTVIMATWDRRLSAAASDAGLSVAPADLA